MKHVLFVDDDQNVLSGLRRILRPYHLEWRMEFCNSADDALRVLAESHIDVVVTDMRMPGKDGAELLTEVRATYPGVVRIGLSGYFSEETTLRAIGLAHQYLSKPCEPETLKYTIIRACALRDHLSDDRLKRLVSRMNTIPSLPTNYQAIVNELHSADPSLPRIGDIIARDMSMTAKVLQLVNSSFFGLARRVTNPTDAATMLGLNTVHALALSAGAFSQLGSDDLGEFSMDALMSHSLAVGHFARAIAATQTRDSQIIDDAFVGGVLHDVGKLVLAANFCEEYSAVLTAHRDSGLSLSAH
ncbi:MAG TPA: HDOD domain-containing protein, partial [Pirellulales bacterium]|nr:HDOD domain-containing protein [Pirellulales bacterium]